MSRWSRYYNSPEKKGYTFFQEQGNPSAALGPAERARQLGLQSNGRGGYIDPQTGQVVARTVNNELIFYDNNSATGGAINDGSGGRALTQSQPSWADPLTGMITTPPSKAETPSEIAAIPDPTPALAPTGYNSFMQKKKEQAYQMNQVDPQPARMTPDEMEQQQQQDQEMAMQGDPGEQQAFAAENRLSFNMFSEKIDSSAAERMAKSFQKNQERIKKDSQSAWDKVVKARDKAGGQFDTTPEGMAKIVQPTDSFRKSQLRDSGRALAAGAATGTAPGLADKNTQSGATPQADMSDAEYRKQGKNILRDLNVERGASEMEEGRRKNLMTALDRILTEPEKTGGAGKNNLSHDDARAFQKYINEGPQNQRHPVSEDELEWAMTYLQSKAGDKWGSLQGRLKGKGDPPSERKVVERAKEVLSSYLENLGTSAIDGSPLLFSESELDHGVSLDNGGEDNGANWRWLPTRFNQFKGALQDEELLKNLQSRLEQDPTDENLKIREQELINKTRGDWKNRFDQFGASGLTVGDIMGMKGAQGMQALKALAETMGISYYKDRGVTRASGRAGGGTSLGVEELQQRLIEKLNLPNQQDIDSWDENMFDVLQVLEDQRADLKRDKRARTLEKKRSKKK